MRYQNRSLSLAKQSMSKGDLVYIPSAVKLESEVHDNVPRQIYTTEKPLHYLVVDRVDDQWLRVYHKGSTWRVKHSDVYEVGA